MLDLMKQINHAIMKADKLLHKEIDEVLQRVIGHLTKEEIHQRCTKIIIEDGIIIYTMDNKVFLKEERKFQENRLHLSYTIIDFVDQDQFIKDTKNTEYWSDSGKYLNS